MAKRFTTKHSVKVNGKRYRLTSMSPTKREANGLATAIRNNGGNAVVRRLPKKIQKTGRRRRWGVYRQ